IPAYFAGDEATDESSAEDPSHRPPPFKAPITPTSSATDRTTQLTTSSRLLSDLDAGYADDIDEAEDDNTLRSCSDKGHRKPRHHSRHHNPMDSSANSTSRPNWSGLESGGPDAVQDEPLVTPAMLVSSSLSAYVSPAMGNAAAAVRQSNRSSLAKPTYPNKTSESSTEDYPLPVRTYNDSADGLTKEQLREALVHLIQNDDDFLHRIHSAYISSLRRRIIK
ncbi:hypothetical protein FGIG_09292, partial [Fasciola gigantica]